METNTVETTLSYKQLLTEWREAFKKVKKNLIKFRKSKPQDKTTYLDGIFKYITVAQAALKKMEFKLITESELIATEISKQITNNPQLPYMEKLNEINNVLGMVQDDEGTEQRKSLGMRKKAYDVRKKIVWMSQQVNVNVRKHYIAQQRQVQAQQQHQNAQITSREEFKRRKAEHIALKKRHHELRRQSRNAA